MNNELGCQLLKADWTENGRSFGEVMVSTDERLIIVDTHQSYASQLASFQKGLTQIASTSIEEVCKRCPLYNPGMYEEGKCTPSPKSLTKPVYTNGQISALKGRPTVQTTLKK